MKHMRISAAALAATMTALSLAVPAMAAPSTAEARTGGAQAGSGTPNQVPQGQRGRLLSNEPLTGAAALAGAASNRLVTYRSEDAAGRPIVVSGTVSLPTTPPPPGGWPVISWAHGTTGTADVCAPSADTVDGPAHDYLAIVDETLDAWVQRGFVVVKTDYEGLGTPGEHPYMNGPSAANTVLDMVRAARRVDHRVGRQWVVIGHSQGGQAALFTAARAAQAKDLDLLGAVAIAPGGVGLSQTAPYIKNNLPGAEYAVAFLPTLLIGAAAADETVDPEALLTETAEPLLEVGRTGCLAEIRQAAVGIDPSQVFEKGADLGPLTDYLDAQDPTGLAVQVPTLVAQGTADALVRTESTDFLVSTLRPQSEIAYEVYDGADHRETVAASLNDAIEFVDALLPPRMR